MFFKVGKTISIGKNYIIFESNYTGYVIYVPNPKVFQKDKVIRLYLYVHKTEFVETMYGFKTFEEKIVFDDLLSVQGVGPKTAIQLLSIGVDNLLNYIASESVESIRQVPYVGERTAAMIIFELKNKYKNKKNKTNTNHQPIEISNTLKTLGFNKNQIDYAMKNIKSSDSVETMIEEAIKIISNAKEFKTTNI